MEHESQEPLDAGLRALWEHVETHWDDPKAHEAFVSAARARGQLRLAAAHYRAASEQPQRGDVAQRQLEGITALAFAELDAARSTPPRRNRWGIAIALLLTVLLGLYIVLVSQAGGG